MNHNYLIADIGGTNARMALCSSANKEIKDLCVYPCNTGNSLEEVITDYLQLHVEIELAGICLAVPGPVEGGTFSFVNNDWVVDPKDLKTVFEAPVYLLNDFSAQALALAALNEAEFDWFDEIRPQPDSIKALVGPGTGTGVGALMENGQVIPSEAGHIAFAPTSRHQEKLLRFTRKKFGRVSVERFLSGPGLVNIYLFNQSEIGIENDASTKPSDITKAAENGDQVALDSIADFWDILAAYAGDIALTFGAKGGLYISGGAALKLTPYLDQKKFRKIFADKGRFSGLCSEISLAICLEQQMGLLGCRQLLRQKGL
jgi:glucokinase